MGTPALADYRLQSSMAKARNLLKTPGTLFALITLVVVHAPQAGTCAYVGTAAGETEFAHELNLLGMDGIHDTGNG